MFVHFLKILILMGIFFYKASMRILKIDGDTIIFIEKIRLLGIDAPETNQYCFDKKIKYSCGLNLQRH